MTAAGDPIKWTLWRCAPNIRHAFNSHSYFFFCEIERRVEKRGKKGKEKRVGIYRGETSWSSQRRNSISQLVNAPTLTRITKQTHSARIRLRWK